MEGETYGFVTIRGRAHCYLTDELMSAYGYKRTFSHTLNYVRFTPESGHYRRKIGSVPKSRLLVSALPPKADIQRVVAKCLLMTQSGHSNPSLKTPVRVNQDGGGAVDGHLVGAQFDLPTRCLRSTFLSSD